MPLGIAGGLKVSRDAYLRHIDGLVFGENPRQGYVDNHVFYHPALKFQFPVPVDWKLNNTPAQVQMVSQRQDAVILFSVEPGYSPGDAVSRFIGKARARVIESNATDINQLPAECLICDIAAQKGTMRVMSCFIQHGQDVFVFHGFSSQPHFQRYRSFFHATMSGFRALTDPKRINVKPDRLRVHTVRTAGTLEDTLRLLDVPDDKLNEMALLNGKYLHDMIPADFLVKVVEKGSC